MQRLRPKRSIRKWLTTVYLTLGIVPLVLMAIVTSFLDARYQLSHVKEVQGLLATQALAEIERVTRRIEASMLTTLSIVDISSMPPGRQRIALSQLRSSLKDQSDSDIVNEIALVQSSGIESARASRLSVTSNEFLKDWSGDKAFEIPIQQGRIYYSPVSYEQRTGEPVVIMGIPIQDYPGSSTKAVLVTELRLKKAWEGLAAISTLHKMMFYIVDKHGFVVAHPLSSVVLRGFIIKEPPSTGIRRGFDGKWAFITTNTLMLGEQRFLLVTEVSLTKALSLPLWTVTTIAVFFVVVLLGAMAFAYLMVQWIIKPVEGLAQTALAISQGDLDRRAVLYGDDEIGVLGRAFNEMASNIANAIKSLQEQITERMSAEEALAREKDRLSVTLRSMTDGVIATDMDGRVVVINRAAQDLLGIGKDQAIGKGLDDVYDPAPTTTVAVNDNGLQRYYSLIAMDGTQKTIQQRKSPLLDSEGQVIGQIIVFRDITQELKAEALIYKQHKLLNSLIESITHPLYIVDAKDYTVKLANSSARFSTLTSESKCYALTHRRSRPCDGADHPCTVREVLNKKGPVVLEHSHHDSHGNMLYIEVHGYPIFDQDGNIPEVIEYTLDITERKKQEERQRRSINLEAIGKLAASVAHEINTPLANASLNIELLAKEAGQYLANTDSLQRLKAIERNVDRASAIAKELLWLARPSESVFVHIEVGSVIESAMAMCERMFKGIDVQYDKGPTCSPLGDPVKLEQALINLISNAVEAMPQGGKLRLSAFEQEGVLIIEVEDIGTGIDDDLIAKIFEPFYTTKRSGIGTGLGLSICSDIVQQHGGDLTITSKKGKGTLVRITIPCSLSH